MGSYSNRKYKTPKIDSIDKEEKIDLYAFGSSLFFHICILLIMSLIFVEPVKHFKTKVELSWSTIEDLEAESDLLGQIDMSANIEDFQEDTIEPINVPNQEISIDIEAPILAESSQEAPLAEQALDIDTISEKFGEEDVIVTSNNVSSSSSSSLDQLIQTVANGLANSSIPTNNGFSTDINSRLKAAGAQNGDVQISISWNSIDDIDLHVEFSSGNGFIDHINWTNRVGRLSNGMLDVDMNANQLLLNNRPVENIFWPPNSSPKGIFNIYVHYFRSWTGERRIPVTVVVKSMGKTNTYNIIAILGMNPQYVTQFSTIVIQKRF